MTKHRCSYARAALFAGSALFFPVFAPIAAQNTTAGVDIKVGAEAISNPYLDDIDASLTAAGSAEVRPWLRSEFQNLTFDLEAFTQVREFANAENLEDNYGASLRVQGRASERAKLFARASIDSTASRVGTVFGPALSNIDEPAFPTPPIGPTLGEDITLLGLRGRSTTINAAAGAQIAWDARTALNVDIGYQNVSFSGNPGEDYQSYSAGLGIMRSLSEQTSVGLTGGVQRADYKGSVIGDATSFTGLFALNHRFNEKLTLNASLGMSATKIEETSVRPKRTVTALATDLSLCDRDSRRGLCLNYRRMPQPTALGGVRTSDTVGMTFDERISEKDRFEMGASYSRTSAGDTATNAVLPSVEYATVRTTFERSFSSRLDGFVYASVARIFRDDLRTDPSINVGVGLRLRFGAKR